jgi:NADH:ubiquinone oxidoreductase subunit E
MIKTDAQKEEFDRMLGYYDTPLAHGDQGTLITILKESQRIFGCVPNAEIGEISKVMKMSEAIIKSLVNRFPSLQGESATHIVLMCNGERCANRQSLALIKSIENFLNILVGQTTGDKRFELRTQHCLGRCMEGPNMNLDSDQYGAMTLDKFKEIAKKYK